VIGAIVRAVVVAVIATITLVALVQLAPTRRPLVVATYLLVMGPWRCRCWSPGCG